MLTINNKYIVLYSTETAKSFVDALVKIKGKNVLPVYFGLKENKEGLFLRLLFRIIGRNVLIRLIYNIKVKYLFDRIGGNNVVIIIKPNKINKIIKKKISDKKDKNIICLWATDSVERFPEQINLKNFASKIYVQDGADQNCSEVSEWLPLGYDSNVFSFFEEKNIDVLIVGNCDGKAYSKRLKYLIKVSELAKCGYNIHYIGFGLKKQIFHAIRKNGVIVHRRVSITELASNISNSKICVNIHQDDGCMPINPLFFAIPNCGTIQIVDERDYFNQWAVQNIDFYAIQINDINIFIKQVLDNYKEYKKEKSRDNKNSYNDRVNKIIHDIELIRNMGISNNSDAL